MAGKGPIPKRSAQVLGHRTQAERSRTTTVVREGAVTVPRLPAGVHPIARRWYNSLRSSEQSKHFEPSDWAAALYAAVMMSQMLSSSDVRPSAVAAVSEAMESLMTTESARRRDRVEVDRVE